MTTSTACAAKPAITTSRKAITVNGVEITRAAISAETQHHPAAKPIDAWMQAARALVVRELLLQEAARLALVPSPLSDADGRRETDDEALVRGLVEREVVTPEPDESTCRRYYDQNSRRFRSSDLFEVSHILLAADPKDREARIRARASAGCIVAALAEQPAQFASLAALHSACPSRAVGGNLGQIGPGQTVPEFERALSTIPVGAVHRTPVESRYGFHVVRVDRREEGRPLPFELVRAGIAEFLGEHVRRTAIRQYISMLAGRATILGIALEGSASPLVQ